MGLAPRPGVSAREEANAAVRRSVTVTMRGVSHTVRPLNVPLRHAAAFRKGTGGLPLRWFLDSDELDVDSFKALWWLGRRLDGEPDLTFDELERDWPDDLTMEDIEAFIEVDDPATDPEADDPEA